MTLAPPKKPTNKQKTCTKKQRWEIKESSVNMDREVFCYMNDFHPSTFIMLVQGEMWSKAGYERGSNHTNKTKGDKGTSNGKQCQRKTATQNVNSRKLQNKTRHHFVACLCNQCQQEVVNTCTWRLHRTETGVSTKRYERIYWYVS